MTELFKNFDLSDFWEDSDYARREYIDDPLTKEKIEAVEATLGYKLPSAYIALSKSQNGGFPKKTSHRTHAATSWSENGIMISGIYSIGSTKAYSLLGSRGSTFWCEEWGYPPIGIYFADCPSAGHDMLCLDYRLCGSTGEPRIVHIDQESDYLITHVADNFESFIRGLEFEDIFD